MNHPANDILQRCRIKLQLQRQSGLYRNPPPIDERQGRYLFCNGRRLINFASNDYLGLGASDTLRRKVADHFLRYGTSSSSSRLVSGNFRTLLAAEQAFADYFGYETALFFPSGYQANVGVLATLFEPGDTVLFDKHIHASSVKGLTLSGAACRGYNHGDLGHLAKRLDKYRAPVSVVTESLFSMDGDILDCEALQRLKQRSAFFCVVDEAHSFGVLGNGGRGVAGGVADVAVGTFGKALGLFGAFALLSAELKDYLLNFASAQIYTTTLPEAHAASALEALALVRDAETQRRHLSDLSRWMRQALTQAGFHVSGDAHVLAVHIGDEEKSVAAARALFDRGLFALPARYPTVPLGHAIVRISLTALHQQQDADLFVHSLKEIHETLS